MVRAIWNGAVLAESDDTVVVEGNHYFPADALNGEYFAASDHHSVCPWKGQASYHDIVVDGKVNRAPRGTTPIPDRQRRRSAAVSPSGTASASKPTASKPTTPGRSPACAAGSPADAATRDRPGK